MVWVFFWKKPTTAGLTQEAGKAFALPAPRELASCKNSSVVFSDPDKTCSARQVQVYLVVTYDECSAFAAVTAFTRPSRCTIRSSASAGAAATICTPRPTCAASRCRAGAGARIPAAAARTEYCL